MMLIKKHSALLCALFVLLAAFSAPYLLPENPDSEVMRSGTLGAILLLACFVPARQGLERADRRTLLAGLVLGLLFSFALSLGAELRFYGGLLPGMGSMLRRLAVPVMAAPYLGCLIARLIAPRASSPEHCTWNIPMWGYMLILLACWTPILLAYFPGMLNYDFPTEYTQFFTGYDNRHPLLYLVTCYAVYHIGQLLSNPTLAVLILTILRMLSLSAALAYACVFLQRRRVPPHILLLVCALFALHPMFSVMSVSSAKDTPFAAAVLTLSLLCWEAAEDPKSFFASRHKTACFVLMIILTWHLRKNGVAALLMLPAVILIVRGFAKKMAVLCAVGLAASFLLAAGMNAALKPDDQPSFQLYSIPAQQLVRTYHLGSMTPEEKEELEGWYPKGFGLTLFPHLADGAKGGLDEERLAQNADAYMSLWARAGAKNPRLYLEAFLMLNMGLWYPDDLSHSAVYQDRPWKALGYLQLDEFAANEYEITAINLLPPVRNMVERVCRYNAYQKYPLVSILFCTATPFWCILLSCAAFFARRRGRFAVSSLGVLGLWASYLFGPCTLPRYVLPLFCLAPVLLALAFFGDFSASVPEKRA